MILGLLPARTLASRIIEFAIIVLFMRCKVQVSRCKTEAAGKLSVNHSLGPGQRTLSPNPTNPLRALATECGLVRGVSEGGVGGGEGEWGGGKLKTVPLCPRGVITVKGGGGVSKISPNISKGGRGGGGAAPARCLWACECQFRVSKFRGPKPQNPQPQTPQP